MMKPDLILIANATHARLLRRAPGTALQLVHSFEHPQSRAKSSDLTSDRSGQQQTDRGAGSASFPPRLDAKAKEHQHFAHELAGHLENEARHNGFHALCIIASSPFLGRLKGELGSAATRLLSGTRDLDLTSVPLHELDARITLALA